VIFGAMGKKSERHSLRDHCAGEAKKRRGNLERMGSGENRMKKKVGKFGERQAPGGGKGQSNRGNQRAVLGRGGGDGQMK